MGAFRTVCFVAVLAVSCGGRTTDNSSAGRANGSGGTSGSGPANASGIYGSGTKGGPSDCALGGTVCPMGETCQRGVCCAIGLIATGNGACVACPDTQTLCGGYCVDTQTDQNNCGGCGHRCDYYGCQAGHCGCPPGFTACADHLCWAKCPAPASSCEGGTCAPIPDAGSAAAGPPSCTPGGPGMTNCGPGGSGTESCCTSLEVTGGTFYRTYSWHADAGVLSSEADPATVSTFRLDRYDVTVGRFRQFAKAVVPFDGGAGWLPAAGSGKHTHLSGGAGLNVAGGSYEPGWVAAENSYIQLTDANLVACEPNSATWTGSAGGQENLPINCVNWYEAYAFCIWDGGFLPSEAEAEYAAAGGSQQREQPWGATDPGTSNKYAIFGCNYPTTGKCMGVTSIAPVWTATLGVGLWGQVDLAGEVWAWTLDVGNPDRYVDPCTDCVSSTAAPARVLRGGFFASTPMQSVPDSRSAAAPSLRSSGGGLRCARTP
jgi:sulfatase modifying factor 1